MKWMDFTGLQKNKKLLALHTVNARRRRVFRSSPATGKGQHRKHSPTSQGSKVHSPLAARQLHLWTLDLILLL